MNSEQLLAEYSKKQENAKTLVEQSAYQDICSYFSNNRDIVRLIVHVEAVITRLQEKTIFSKYASNQSRALNQKSLEIYTAILKDLYEKATQE